MAPKLKPSRAKYRSTSPITATYSYDNPAPTAAIAPQTFSSNPKPGHAKRRSTSPITATYSYDDPATPTAATSPQTFSFDTSACAAVTGATPLADSPAAAPVVRPPSTAAALEGHSSKSAITSGAQSAEQVATQRPASNAPGAMAWGEGEEPRSLSSLPAELLTLVAENLRIPNASLLSAQSSLARFAAASTACLAAAQGELRAAFVKALEEVSAVRAALSLPYVRSGANEGPGSAKIFAILRYQALRRAGLA